MILALRIFTLSCASALASIAAIFSVIGLMKIFPGSEIGIMIMAIGLEAAKIAAALWLHQTWKIIAAWIKTYLLSAVIVLMAITSMGIFGYLSNAHLEHQETQDVLQIDTSLIENNITQKEDMISRLNLSLQTLDGAFNRSVEEGFVTRAFEQRKETEKERKAISDSIGMFQKELAEHHVELSNVQKGTAASDRKLGPLKYLVELMGAEEESNAAVQYLMLAIVATFDPLAIVLLIAGLKRKEEEKPKEPPEETPEILSEPIEPEEAAEAPKSASKESFLKQVDDIASRTKPRNTDREGPDRSFYDNARENKISSQKILTNQPLNGFPSPG